MRLATLLLLLLAAVPVAAQPYVYIGRSTTGLIDRVNESGAGSNAGTRIAQFVAPATDIAFDGTYLYVASETGNEISRIDTRLTSNNVENGWIAGFPGGSINGITTDNTFLYWTDRLQNRILRVALNSTRRNLDTQVVITVSNSVSLRHVTVDGTFVYWTDDANDSIGRALKDGSGGNSNGLFVTGLTNPVGITTQGSFIYWANRTAGSSSIGRVDKDGTTNLDINWQPLNTLYTPWGITATPTNLFVVLLPNGPPTGVVQSFPIAGGSPTNVYQPGGANATDMRGVIATTSTDANLPVELTTFSATLDGSGARLDWATASETNNTGFHVEHHAPDATGFRDLDFLPGAGSTLEAQSYTFRTTALAPGVHRFRLRQIDLDGAQAFSPVVELAVGLSDAVRLAISPNPASQSARVSIQVARAQQVDVTLYDLLGRRVATLFDGPMESGEALTHAVDAAQMPSGVYSVVVAGETFRTTQTLTVAR